jgi:hypothetical protein
MSLYSEEYIKYEIAHVLLTDLILNRLDAVCSIHHTTREHFILTAVVQLLDQLEVSQ